MALPVLDGNQSATTLSSVVTGGEHIVAHTVVSLGSTAISNITSAVSGSVVSISNFPSTQTIAGTVTANVLAGQYTTITASSISVGSNSGLIDISSYPNGVVLSVEIQPTGGANGVYKIQSIDAFGFGALDISVTNIFTGASTINISATGTYSFRKNQTNTHLRLTYVSGSGASAPYTIRAFSESYWNQTVPVSISSVTIGSISAAVLPRWEDDNQGGNQRTVKQSTPFPVRIYGDASSTSVTFGATITNSVTIGSVPNGSLTTRFGTPTTANTAFATSAVTNANRKYLLIQNVTTGSNVITVGIGFTPTTTQGIQLTAGAGITFESSYIPTGQIFVLSSVTASNFTILEA